MTIPDLYNQFKKLNINTLQQNAIMSAKAEIVDTIVEKQLMKGIKGDGTKVGNYKSQDYKKLKQSMNPKAGGNVDLRLTGYFHSSFVCEPTNYGAYVYAKDEKAEKLESWYSEKIYDLTKENKQEITTDIILPNFLKDIKKSVQL